MTERQKRGEMVGYLIAFGMMVLPLAVWGLVRRIRRSPVKHVAISEPRD